MLAFSMLSGPPTVRLLGNTPVMFSGSLRGLGYSDTTPCSSIPPGDPYRDPSNICQCPDGVNFVTFNDDGSMNTSACEGDTTIPSASSGGPSWWESALTAFTKGAAQGALAPKPGTYPTSPMPITQPWYTQWWGIGAIAVGVLGAGALLLGGPAKKSAPVSGHRRK